jgi:hypothetical protein
VDHTLIKAGMNGKATNTIKERYGKNEIMTGRNTLAA